MKRKQRGIILGTVALLLSAIAMPLTWLSPIESIALAKDSRENLIDEVWQIIDREYVDSTFNRKDWKAISSQFLQRKYRDKEGAYGSVSLLR